MCLVAGIHWCRSWLVGLDLNAIIEKNAPPKNGKSPLWGVFMVYILRGLTVCAGCTVTATDEWVDDVVDLAAGLRFDN